MTGLGEDWDLWAWIQKVVVKHRDHFPGLPCRTLALSRPEPASSIILPEPVGWSTSLDESETAKLVFLILLNSQKFQISRLKRIPGFGRAPNYVLPPSKHAPSPSALKAQGSWPSGKSLDLDKQIPNQATNKQRKGHEKCATRHTGTSILRCCIISFKRLTSAQRCCKVKALAKQPRFRSFWVPNPRRSCPRPALEVVADLSTASSPARTRPVGEELPARPKSASEDFRASSGHGQAVFRHYLSPSSADHTLEKILRGPGISVTSNSKSRLRNKLRKVDGFGRKPQDRIPFKKSKRRNSGFLGPGMKEIDRKSVGMNKVITHNISCSLPCFEAVLESVVSLIKNNIE